MAHQMFALYEEAAEASLAADRLVANGIPQHKLSLVVSEGYGAKHLGIEAGTKGAEGVASGVTLGGVMGGIAGALAGTGLVAATGGAVLVAGPIVAALAGIGAGGAAGGLLGGLIGLGIPDQHVKAYEDALDNEGGVVLGVEIDDDNRSKVKEILKETGGKALSTD